MKILMIILLLLLPTKIFLVLPISACRIMDIPRLNAKSITINIVKNAIKDVCLNLRYAAYALL